MEALRQVMNSQAGRFPTNVRKQQLDNWTAGTTRFGQCREGVQTGPNSPSLANLLYFCFFDTFGRMSTLGGLRLRGDVFNLAYPCCGRLRGRERTFRYCSSIVTAHFALALRRDWREPGTCRRQDMLSQVWFGEMWSQG